MHTGRPSNTCRLQQMALHTASETAKSCNAADHSHKMNHSCLRTVQWQIHRGMRAIASKAVFKNNKNAQGCKQNMYQSEPFLHVIFLGECRRSKITKMYKMATWQKHAPNLTVSACVFFWEGAPSQAPSPHRVGDTRFPLLRFTPSPHLITLDPPLGLWWRWWTYTWTQQQTRNTHTCRLTNIQPHRLLIHRCSILLSISISNTSKWYTVRIQQISSKMYTNFKLPRHNVTFIHGTIQQFRTQSVRSTKDS